MKNWRHVRVCVVAFVFAAFTGIAFGQIGGTLPGPLPLFPSDNWWNADVSSAPLDSNSAAFINFIGATRSLHPDLGGDITPGVPADGTYGIPYVVVPGTEPMPLSMTNEVASVTDHERVTA